MYNAKRFAHYTGLISYINSFLHSSIGQWWYSKEVFEMNLVTSVFIIDNLYQNAVVFFFNVSITSKFTANGTLAE